VIRFENRNGTVSWRINGLFRESESLFRRVNGKSRSLSFYVEYALARFCEPKFQKTLAPNAEL